MKRVALVVVSLVVGMLGFANSTLPAAGAVECTETLRTNVTGDVIVPNGAQCAFAEITVDGNVHVGDSANLYVFGGRINGSVDAARSRILMVGDARVTGDITATHMRQQFSVYGTSVDGSILVSDSDGLVQIASSMVSSSVSFLSNTGENVVSGNVIGRYLVCKENSPAPEAAVTNVVSARASDQCAQIAEKPVTDAGQDLYVTTGFHEVNGRQWRTSCQVYSATERCRTEIQATTVHQFDGQFKVVNDWTFNNLTYKASSRSLWSENPLGGYGKYGGGDTWFGTDGRQWRTECDTALTGRGGCRTWVTASVIEYSDGQYQWVTKEILNNMVRFSD